MLTQYIHHYPALGKGDEFRALLRDRVSGRNDRGSRHSLRIRVMAPENEALVVILHESLSAMQSYRAGNAADDGFPAFMAKIEAVIAHQPVNELWDVIAPASTTEGAGYAWRSRMYPASPDAGSNLMVLLAEQHEALEANGVACGISTQLFAPEGEAYEIVLYLRDLVAVDKHVRTTFDVDWLQRVSELSRLPVAQALYQIAIPLPER